MPGAEWIVTGHGDKSLWAAAPPMNLLNDRTREGSGFPLTFSHETVLRRPFQWFAV